MVIWWYHRLLHWFDLIATAVCIIKHMIFCDVITHSLQSGQIIRSGSAPIIIEKNIILDRVEWNFRNVIILFLWAGKLNHWIEIDSNHFPCRMIRIRHFESNQHKYSHYGQNCFHGQLQTTVITLGWIVRGDLTLKGSFSIWNDFRGNFWWIILQTVSHQTFVGDKHN